MRKDSGIKVIGSLNPQKEVQDRVRVLSSGGELPIFKSDRLQRPTKSFGVGSGEIK